MLASIDCLPYYWLSLFPILPLLSNQIAELYCYQLHSCLLLLLYDLSYETTPIRWPYPPRVSWTLLPVSTWGPSIPMPLLLVTILWVLDKSCKESPLVMLASNQIWDVIPPRWNIKVVQDYILMRLLAQPWLKRKWQTSGTTSGLRETHTALNLASSSSVTG